MATSDSDDGFAHQGDIAFRVATTGHPSMTLMFESLAWPSLSARSSVQLAFPTAGYAGSAASISTQARYAAVMLYSGQSETGYELFELTPTLRHLAGLAYVAGECDLSAPAFSPDERLAALAVEHCSWWFDADATHEDAGASEEAAHGGITTWATLFVHELGIASPTTFALLVDLPKGWSPVASGTWPRRLRFSGPATLTLGVPWLEGEFSFDLPSSERRIVIPPPATS